MTAKITMFVAGLLLLAGMSPLFAEEKITKEQVSGLVAATVTDLEKDAAATIGKINKGEAPYKNAANPELYVFVYDLELNMVAHADKNLVGKNFKGKPDAKGKKFRDEIVATVQEKGSGWVDYVYKKPDADGLFPKTTFCKAAKGSDGKQYAVCCGMYLEK